MLRVGVIGATGYTGGELLRILLGHPQVEITCVTSRSAVGKEVAEVHPALRSLIKIKFSSFELEEIKEKTDLCFCALPHKESMETVAVLLGAGLKVIDLSADYRLRDTGEYETWYKTKHSQPAEVAKAVYGLPEINRDKIKDALLVANPGCYPTASILALAPLAEKGLLDFDSLIIDAKSGTSGAGRNPNPVLHYPDCTENFRAYKVAVHQHTPEIQQELTALAEEKVQLTFTPHLVPMARGILATCYGKLKEKISQDSLGDIFMNYYGNEPFLRLLEPPLLPETKGVWGSNFCDLSWRLEERTGRVIILSAIDNLVKGAAGQAVQNMNILSGFPETTGLLLPPVKP